MGGCPPKPPRHQRLNGETMPNSTQGSECAVNRETRTSGVFRPQCAKQRSKCPLWHADPPDQRRRPIPEPSRKVSSRRKRTAAARTRVETMSHRERATNSVWNCIESNVSGPDRAVWPPDEQSVKPSEARVAGRCASPSGNMRRHHSPPDQQRRANERHKFNEPQCACAEFCVGPRNSSPRHLALSNSSCAHRGRPISCSNSLPMFIDDFPADGQPTRQRPREREITKRGERERERESKREREKNRVTQKK